MQLLRLRFASAYHVGVVNFLENPSAWSLSVLQIDTRR
jgi:hypothetical protein